MDARIFGRSHAEDADGIFDERRNAFDLFDQASFDGDGLFRKALILCQVTEKAEAGRPDELGCPGKDGPDQGTETFLLFFADGETEQFFCRLLAGNEFVHVARRKIRDVPFEVFAKDDAADFAQIAAADHLFKGMVARQLRRFIDEAVPDRSRAAVEAGRFQVDDHLQGRFIIAHVKARATDDADARRVVLIDRRKEGRRRIVEQGHRFDAVQASPDEGLFQQAIDGLAGHAGNGDFLGPGDEAGILGRRLVDGKGKGKAQFIVVIAISRFLDDGGDEVEEFVCRLRRSRVVVVSAFQGFGHLAFYGKALFAHEADARSPDVRAAEIQGQKGPRFPSRRQAQIGAQRRKGALLPFQSVFGTLSEVLCQFPQLCAG